MGKDPSEIAKLTERISKDPKSKLFVPLAEEYKKAGDIEMAIHVLSEGLKSNPGYVTARSFLGRLLLDQGNLAASQKEFEEVVKAIPDNLLAQRKLGDLFALQNNRDEALKHYKIALSLNPGDAEFASLVADFEAGLDVKARIQQPKAKSSPEQPAAPPPLQQPAPQPAMRPTADVAAPAAPAGAAQAVTPKAPEPAPESATPKEEPAAYEWPEPAEDRKESAAPAKDSSDLAGLALEEEEAEEVLLVEPLEDEAPALALGNEEFQLALEPGVAEEQGEAALPTLPAFEEPDIFPSAESEPVVTLQAPEEVIAGPGTAPGQEEADDFTTDTLAELYIQQGFYEKAIDIYQRMLAENPNSRGLKDKLARVREMAGPEQEKAPASEKETPEQAPASVFSEPSGFAPTTVENEEEITVDAEVFVEPEEETTELPTRPGKKAEDIFAEPQEYHPPAEAGEWPQEAAGERPDDAIFSTPEPEIARAKPDADFEPREYIPPTAMPAAVSRGKMQAAPAAAPSKKETIDRLENWLKNIKKEK